MGMDISFMVVSKNKQQMQDLRNYINELYSRDYTDDYRKMNGYDMEILHAKDFFILTGEHRNCFGWDLGYWCKQENRNDLITDVFYLEERQDDWGVYLYRADDPDSEDGLLDIMRVLYDGDNEQVDNAKEYDFPSGLHDLIMAYFCDKRKYEKMQIERID